MSLVQGSHGRYETDTISGGLLLTEPADQIVGALEQDHFLAVFCVKTGICADFTIKIVPLQTR